MCRSLLPLLAGSGLLAGEEEDKSEPLLEEEWDLFCPVTIAESDEEESLSHEGDLESCDLRLDICCLLTGGLGGLLDRLALSFSILLLLSGSGEEWSLSLLELSWLLSEGERSMCLLAPLFKDCLD